MKKKKEDSLLALKIELAISILLFVMMMGVIILTFVVMARGGIIVDPPQFSEMKILPAELS